MSQESAKYAYPTGTFLMFLKTCFYLYITMLIGYLLMPVFFMLNHYYYPELEFKKILSFFLVISYTAIFLWFYSLYFYFRYDRYSSAGLKLFFLFFYPPIYFYKVIWKKKRDLINKIKYEPVLDNKIYLETIDNVEHTDNNFWDTNYYKNPPLEPEMVINAENYLGVKLPDAYIDLLRVQNGGYTKGFIHPMQVKTSWAEDHIPLHELYGIVTNNSLDSAHNILDSFYLINEWNLPEEQVVIAGQGHWWITLDYRECEIPCVRWIDIDMNQDILIASSFDEFSNGLIQPAAH